MATKSKSVSAKIVVKVCDIKLKKLTSGGGKLIMC